MGYFVYISVATVLPIELTAECAAGPEMMYPEPDIEKWNGRKRDR
jgi:hypothetical protein